MTARHLADEPELVPPAELLRLRAELRRGPSASTRARHLAAAVEVSRLHAGGSVGRFASRGVRAAVAVVASLVITSGLAAAQVLPPPAQRFLSSVSDRFSPPPTARPASAGDTGSGSDGSASTLDPAGGPVTEAGDPTVDDAATATSDGASSTRPSSTATTQPGTTVTTAPPVTLPGPLGPGSPEDPADPGTDGGPTDPGTDEPSDPGTTTTTTPGGTDGGTDGAGTADATTTTTTTAPGSGGSA